MSILKPGDKVAYTANFLRSIGEVTGDMPARRGTVTSIAEPHGGLQLAHVRWDDGAQGAVNINNITTPGSRAFSAN